MVFDPVTGRIPIPIPVPNINILLGLARLFGRVHGLYPEA